jgi:neutral ceramidase
MFPCKVACYFTSHEEGGMPLYAGVCETNITPPLGVWMSGYGGRPTPAVGVHDELFARALVFDNGERRVVLITADVIALDYATVERVRKGIAAQIHVSPDAIMLHCTHTHAGPNIGTFRCMGTPDASYTDILTRKLIGVAKQAASLLRPTTLTYGEGSVQIGVNRRQTRPDGKVILGTDFGGPVAPTVQVLCVNEPNGQTFALLFCHACHPTTLGGENLHFSAEWPGAAVAHLKERFRTEGAGSGIAPDALPFCLQGCCGDINPIRRGTWEAIAENGRIVAEAAHTARWNAHGRLDETLDAAETTLELPMLPPPSLEECESWITQWEVTLEKERTQGASEGRLNFLRGRLAWAKDAREYAGRGEPFDVKHSFAVQRLNIGGASFLGFPAEIFVQYQLDFVDRVNSPVFALSYTNGCWNYVPTAKEYARGGYEVEDAHKYYGTLMFAPECETIIRQAAYDLLSGGDSDTTPYPLMNGRAL